MKKNAILSLLFIFFLILMLFLSACGGADQATEVVEDVSGELEGEPQAEEAAEEVVEEVEKVVEVEATVAVEMVEEEIEEVAEEAMADDGGEDFSADRSESEGGAPSEPSSGSKAEPTRTAAEVALAGSPEEVRVGEEAEVSLEVPDGSQLTAGEIDDNQYWDDYLLYLRQWEDPDTIWLDVVERHVVRVVDANGRPVVGETVTVLVNNVVVETRHTHSDGEVMVFPNAFDNLGQLGQFDQIEVVLEETGDSIRLTVGGNQRDWTLNALSYSKNPQTQLDVLFLVDGTGSMADEIAALTDNMIAISQQINNLPERPDTRYSLVVYRDKEDLTPLEKVDFLVDVNTFTLELADVRAEGGGDYPEDLTLGMHEALNNSWRVENTVSLIFLVADAPPQLGYDYSFSYTDKMMQAAENGIKVFSIASSGLDAQGEYVFRQMSQYTGGKFIFLTYGEGGAGTTGEQTDVNVDPDNYTVDSLDELIVNLIEAELANLSQVAVE